MVVRLLTLLVWALVAASAVSWAWKVARPGSPVPPGASVAGGGSSSIRAGGDFSRILGTPPPAPLVAPAAAAIGPEPGARYQLVGLAAPSAGRRGGVALIAVDGKPAKAVRVGQPVEPGVTLQQILRREVVLARGEEPPLSLALAAQQATPHTPAGTMAPPPMPAPVPAPGAAPGGFARPMVGGVPVPGVVTPNPAQAAARAFSQPGVQTPPALNAPLPAPMPIPAPPIHAPETGPGTGAEGAAESPVGFPAR